MLGAGEATVVIWVRLVPDEGCGGARRVVSQLLPSLGRRGSQTIFGAELLGCGVSACILISYYGCDRALPLCENVCVKLFGLCSLFFMEKYCLCGLSVQCLCVCACVCMHMLVFCVCMHVCVCLCFSMRVCLCVCEHARVCGAVCVHVHVLGKWRGIKHLFCVFLNQEALCFRIGQAWTLCVLPWVIQPESGGNGIRSGLWHLTSTHLTCRTTPVCQGVQP